MWHKHRWKYMWLSNEIEGYRCTICGKQTLELNEKVLMAKCLHCLSCLKYITLFERKYLYCSFCRRVYVVENSKLKEVTDMNLIMEARKITGNVVI